MNLRQRVITSILAIPLVLAPLVFTPLYSVLGAAVIILLLAHAEIRTFNGKAALPVPLLGLSALLISSHFINDLPAWVPAVVGFMGIGSCLFVPHVPSDAAPWKRFLHAEWLSFAWIATTLWAFVAVHQRGNPNVLVDFRNPILFGFIPLWIGDTTAMLVGRRFGKHKLLADVSPGKTWEGAISNFVANILGAVLLGSLMGIDLTLAAAIGAGTGFLGQLGDLFESWIKRKFEVKDSGTLFPGHGGLLDRYDSLGFAALAILSVLLLLRP